MICVRSKQVLLTLHVNITADHWGRPIVALHQWLIHPYLKLFSQISCANVTLACSRGKNTTRFHDRLIQMSNQLASCINHAAGVGSHAKAVVELFNDVDLFSESLNPSISARDLACFLPHTNQTTIPHSRKMFSMTPCHVTKSWIN